MTRAAGLLLTGGSSRRLGVDKATLLVDGERLVDRVARALTDVVAPVLEVGPGHSSFPAVREQPPGAGPLAALVAGADALLVDGAPTPVVVLAVDLPFVDARFVDWLAMHRAPESVVPVVDGMPQPLCARYSVDALGAARDLEQAGERSMRALLAAVAVHEADEDEWRAVATARTFHDVDTRDDLDALGLSSPG
ncbi:MAG TPA: molybdenum cofactor guanylyltransferase [Acidimicrobiia bacterium]